MGLEHRINGGGRTKIEPEVAENVISPPGHIYLDLMWGGAKSKKVDLLRYFWKIDLEKIYFFYFFDLYLKFFEGLFRVEIYKLEQNRAD